MRSSSAVRTALGLVSASLAVSCFMPVSCGPSAPPPPGQFGAYGTTNMLLHMPDGDTLTVYRVKYWVFSDGDPPRLQLEYASRVPARDTSAVAKADYAIWPSFAPYVEHLGLKHALLTATNLTWMAGGRMWSRHSYGMLVDRDDAGEWHLERHSEALPAADTGSMPRITQPNGKPFPFTTTPPRLP